MNETLFPLPDRNEPPGETGSAEPRVQRPNRMQLELRPVDLEGLLPADHRARLVWEFVEGLDLGPLYVQIKAVTGHAGRPAIDPAILMALWLYATLEGVGSARALARLCEEHDAYRWLAGGVSVNYHTVADVRVAHGDVLDSLLTTSVAALMAEGIVELRRVAHAGVTVRASAGAASFRRGDRLEQLLTEATAQVERLRRELDDDPAATARRQAAARQRAAGGAAWGGAAVGLAPSQRGGDGGVARRHGDRRGEGDLQGAGRDERMRECPGSESRAAPVRGARAAQGEGGAPVVCPCPQSHAGRHAPARARWSGVNEEPTRAQPRSTADTRRAVPTDRVERGAATGHRQTGSRPPSTG